VLPLSIVGGIGLKISARIGYSQIWLHKTQVGQDWVQAPLQDELKLNHQQLIAEAPVEASAQGLSLAVQRQLQSAHPLSGQGTRQAAPDHQVTRQYEAAQPPQGASVWWLVLNQLLQRHLLSILS
jgi:hypothetical protein